MQVTSILIGGVEMISVCRKEATEINVESNGKMSTARLEAVFDTTATSADDSSKVGTAVVGTAVVGTATLGLTLGIQQAVTIMGGATYLFAGYVARLSPQVISPNLIRYAIDCQDNTRLLDRAMVASATYTAWSDEAILDDLFATYLPAITTTGVIGTSPETVLDSITFENLSLRACVDRICERTGAEWRLGFDGDLKYYAIGSNDGAFDFSDAHSQNLILRSEELQNGPWEEIAVTVETSGVVAVIDSATMFHVIEDTSTGTHQLRQTFTWVNGQTYVTSIYAKAGARTRLWLINYDGVNTLITKFDLSAGTVISGTGAIVSVGSGVYRCSQAMTAAASGATIYAAQFHLAEGTVNNYTGDGTSGLYLWGAQINEGSTALVYIQATDAVVDRTGDEYVLQSDFGYQEEFSQPANAVSVVGYQAPKPDPVEMSLGVTASGDDGWVLSYDYYWPPSGVPSVYTSGHFIVLHHSYYPAVPEYDYSNGFIKFDTSTIPSDATITSAVLQFFAYLTGSAVGRAIGIEYYNPSNWPIGASDLTFDPGASPMSSYSPNAFAWRDIEPYALPASSAAPKLVEFKLVNIGNISKTGSTGFRLFLGADSYTGQCEMGLGAVDNTTERYRPKLLITYQLPQPGPISGYAEDAASIALYGTFAKTITDTATTTEGEADARAAVETVRYGYPRKSINCTYDRDGLNVGDTVHFVSSLLGIDDEFIVKRLRLRWPRAQDGTRYYAELGEARADLIEILRKG